MRACQIQEFGGPEVLQVVDVPKPEPGDGEVLIEVSRAGMNFADTHQRENSYLARYEVPLVLGGEVVGTTPDGQRVVALMATGGYAEYAVAHESTVFPIPDGMDEGAALALLIHGLTAWHLFKTSAKLAPGRVGGRDLGRRRSRQPRGAAREAVRRRPRDRHGEHRGEAREGDRAGSGCRGGRCRGGPQGRADRGERGQAGGRGARDVGRPRVRPVRRRARPVRPDRGVRHCEPRAEHASRPAG